MGYDIKFIPFRKLFFWVNKIYKSPEIFFFRNVVIYISYLCISTRLERWCSQKIELISFNKKILALNVKVAILESKLLFLTSYFWPKYTFNELNSIFWLHHRSYGMYMYDVCVTHVSCTTIHVWCTMIHVGYTHDSRVMHHVSRGMHTWYTCDAPCFTWDTHMIHVWFTMFHVGCTHDTSSINNDVITTKWIIDKYLLTKFMQ